MPRINRIRVTNIQYDYGKKQFPDLLFDLSSQDGLLLLTNGGGKTLLLQLIIQTILPNAQLQGRKISDLLRNAKFTGHIAVEWLLDNTGDKKQYLCTGFCFTSALDGTLKRFNYMFDYDALEQSETTLVSKEDTAQEVAPTEEFRLTIESLPFVQVNEDGSKKPIHFQQLRDWLREETNQLVQIFDQDNIYQERLRFYQILPEEWKNIRDTNDSEGGVDKFFEKCKTTFQLMENLLVPSAEQVIFRDELKKQELIKVFSEYRYSLLQIPIIKQNIVDFAIIQEQSEYVVGVVQELEKAKKKLEVQTDELLTLAKLFTSHQNEATVKINEHQEQIVKTQQSIKDLQWKIKSYQVFTSYLAYLEAKAEEEEKKLIYDHSLLHLNRLKQEENQLFALYHYQQYLEAQEEVAEYKKRMQIMDQEEPELVRELTAEKSLLVTAWKRALANFKRQEQELNTAIRELSENLGLLKKAIEDHRLQVEKLITRKGSLQAWLDDYALKGQELTGKISDFNFKEPSKTAGEYQEKLLKQKEQVKSLDDLLKTLEKDLKNSTEQIFQVQLEKQALNNQLSVIDEKLEKCNTVTNKLEGLLTTQGIFTTQALEQKDTLVPKVYDLWEQSQQEVVLAQATLSNLEEKWALIQNRDCYVPHPLLLQVQQQLAKMGITVLLGSEWLKSQTLSEEEKNTCLQKYPLLPFTVIVESTLLGSLERAVRSLQNLPADFPILFLVRQSLANDLPITGSQLFTVQKDQLYTYHSSGIKIYSLEKYFIELKEKMEQEIKEQKERLACSKEKYQSLVYLRSEMEHFYNEFCWEQYNEWLRLRLSLSEKNKQKEQKLQELHSQEKGLTTKLETTKSSREKLNQEVLLLEQDLYLIKAFLPLHQQHLNQIKALESVTLEIREIKLQIAEKEATVERNWAKQEKYQQQLKANQGATELHQREFVDYQLEDAPGQPTDLEYSQLKGKVNAIFDRLKGGQSKREDLERLLELANERQLENQQNIEEREVNWEWLQDNQRNVNRDECQTARKARLEGENQVDSNKERWLKAQGKTRSCRDVQESLSQLIVDEFESEPYLEFSKQKHTEEHHDLNQRLEILLEQVVLLNNHKEDLEKWQTENQEAYDMVAESYGTLLKEKWNQLVTLTPERWEAYNAKPRAIVRRLENSLEESKGLLELAKNQVNQAFQDYVAKLERTNNSRVHQFTRTVRTIMAEERLYDYDFVETQFLRIFEGIDEYQKQYQRRLDESNKNFEHLVNLSLRRAQTIYESIHEIPKNSRINLYERDIQLIKMDWPTREAEENHEYMRQYLNQVIENMNTWKQEGMDDDALERRLEGQLQTRALLNVIAPIENCRVQVFKPRQESLVRNQRIEHVPWDDVCRWSGGENYSTNITMFMVILSHIRQQMEGKYNSWKVLAADNPFGKASSPHVLDPVFKVAQANQIQLICFTAHKQDTILNYFPVVYSLQLRSTYGKEVLQAEKLESGFYRVSNE
mgnify:FL=1